jgi:hypothetical protein
MSEKIAVPEGMLEAGREAWKNGLNSDIPSTLVRHILEAALRYQSNNPAMPTVDQMEKMTGWSKINDDLKIHQCLIVILAWQRRMYDAPEPEVPEEIRSLQRIRLDWVKDQDDLNRLVTELNVESFRRGQESTK